MLNEEGEKDEVEGLLAWWDRYAVFGVQVDCDYSSSALQTAIP
jgi:hypothetical protein